MIALIIDILTCGYEKIVLEYLNPLSQIPIAFKFEYLMYKDKFDVNNNIYNRLK